MADFDTFAARIAQLTVDLAGDERDAFTAGVDCARHGANSTNCHIRHFATRERTAAWQHGKRVGEIARA